MKEEFIPFTLQKTISPTSYSSCGISLKKLSIILKIGRKLLRSINKLLWFLSTAVCILSAESKIRITEPYHEEI